MGDYSVGINAFGYEKDIAELEKLCFSEPWSENAVNEFLKYENNRFLIAKCEKDGSFAGYIGFSQVLDELHIANIAVKPGHRRKGAADMLLYELERKAKDGNISLLTLEVRKSNYPAIKLYEKHGYKAVGERKDFYLSPKEDAVLMNLEIKTPERNN
ncbi:MAG: ribosomal protein S18-alanine N-acetyltransferase [Clostridiales bacterium]|nr:ribosomal protein S18-alanine N-acetyltransferase [Clostridiales bacterium]